MINRYIVAVLCVITSIVLYEPGARAQQGANNPWRMAYAARRSQNYAEVMRWYQQIYQQGAGTVDPYEALGDRATAAQQIGDLYADGLGVPRDYSMAAQWYQRSMALGTLAGNGSRARLGILYAWGLGVPQNRAMARQLFAQIDGNAGQSYIDLLDNNLLPRSNAEVRDAMGRLATLKRQQQARREAQEAQEESAREAAAEREARLHPSPPPARSVSQGNNPWGSALCNHMLGTSSWNVFSPCNH
jgi:TPR repeat protein